jgi:hypothetical protein
LYQTLAVAVGTTLTASNLRKFRARRTLSQDSRHQKTKIPNSLSRSGHHHRSLVAFPSAGVEKIQTQRDCMDHASLPGGQARRKSDNLIALGKDGVVDIRNAAAVVLRRSIPPFCELVADERLEASLAYGRAL